MNSRSTNNYDDIPQRPEDPRDATIRELGAEVERLAGLLDGYFYNSFDAGVRWRALEEAGNARALLARLAGGSDS